MPAGDFDPPYPLRAVVREATRVLFGHLALAVARHVKDLGFEGRPVPAELVVLREFFLDCASARQDAPSFADPPGTGDAGSMTSSTSLLLSKRDAAGVLRVSARTVDRLLVSGDLVAVRIGGSVRIKRADLDAYVAGLGRSSFRDHIEEKAAS